MRVNLITQLSNRSESGAGTIPIPVDIINLFEIDLFEAVDVADHHRYRSLFPRRPAQLPLQQGEDAASIPKGC